MDSVLGRGMGCVYGWVDGWMDACVRMYVCLVGGDINIVGCQLVVLTS